MSHPFAATHISSDLEKALEELPDQVAEALKRWRIATIEREKLDAVLYLKFKMSDQKRTSEEIKALVRSSDERYALCLKEAMAESDYKRLDERLMSWKKLASLRSAF